MKVQSECKYCGRLFYFTSACAEHQETCEYNPNHEPAVGMHPYLVVEIENSPLPMEFDIYYLRADPISQTTNLIEGIVEALEVGDKPVKLTVSLVELNDEQSEYIYESDGEFDIGELESLAKKEVNNGA